MFRRSKRCYGTRSHRRKVRYVNLLSRNFASYPGTISHKNLLDEICKLETDATVIEAAINESRPFEVSSKAKLNSIKKFLNKNVKNENSSP